MAGPSDKSSIIEFFLVEAGDHLQNLNTGLLSLEKNSSDMAMIDELFRAAHTLKGSAAMMGFQGISDVAHKTEDMLGQFRAGTIPICKESLNFLFDSVDAVKLMVDGIATNEPEDMLVIDSIERAYQDVVDGFQKSSTSSDIPSESDSDSDLLREVDIDQAWEKTFDISSEELIDVKLLDEKQEQASDLVQGEDSEKDKKTGTVEKRTAARRAADTAEVEKQFIRVNIERLDNLMNLVGEMIVGRNRLTRQVDQIKMLREELSFCQNRLLHEIKKFEEKYEYTMSFETPDLNRQLADQPGDFLELEFDRYDDFNLLSRKLTEITNDTNEIMNELAGFFDSFELDTARIYTVTTNLQDEITLARMIEVDKLYQMLQRPVRDLAQEESKQINMVATGGDTKIDKTIFEIISDPLMHMIRNAISHGIESVAERKVLGKEPTGLLMLRARHEGNSIIIEIEDDGRGMDPLFIRNTAVDKGFITPAEARTLTDLETINLIFRPGFSTTATVGKVSGRGVGMDVVSNQLARVNGRIEIQTEKGVGTKFLIRLPLTLTIVQSLIVKLKDQEIAIPMNLVEETTRFSYKDIQHAAGEEMVNLRGTLIRLLRLNEVLDAGRFPKKDDLFRQPTLILGMAEKRLALMVEDIIGREEIVVKSLGDYLKGIKFFSGATISGDGNVRLILNIVPLFGEETVAIFSRVGINSINAEAIPEVSTKKPRVLIVDDSISIRKYVQRFLDRSGYEVEAASDGMEALNIMGRLKFDAVITDLEMPVMHGYDLMVEMRKGNELMKIPVIVLTSRSGEKHRQKALDMGAQEYLVKPFEEQEMLGALKKVLSGTTVTSHS